MYCFCVVLCIVYVCMCTELLPSGGYPIAVKCHTYMSLLSEGQAGEAYERFKPSTFV
jgi:hypothetical protein